MLTVVCTVGFVVPSATSQTNVTIQATHHHAIGGEGRLDRAKYFNYAGTLQGPTSSGIGNLREQTWSPTGLNIATGRVATELDSQISFGLPEDPNKPGFIDRDALIHEIQFGSQPDQRDSYRALTLGQRYDGTPFPSNLFWIGTRWEGLRKQQELSLTNPKVDAPIFIQSGRNEFQWPDFFDGGGRWPINYEAYADFLNVYLEEAVYGTDPDQGFLPIDKDRFYIEVMNEPNWSTPSQSQWDEVIEMHQVVTELVKEQFPQAKIGGPSCCDDLGSGGNGWERSRQLMDDMTSWQTPSGQSVELDFWTIHNYEHYRVQSNGSPLQTSKNSPGHVSGIMDLYESYSYQKFGDPKAFAITEYGSWNSTSLANGSYGNYTRTEQQWDLVRDVREKMLVYMNRPDRIINATPFVSPVHWQSGTPTPAVGDNVFFEQDAAGSWSETIVAKMFRMFAPVSGNYVPVDSNNPDLQTVAFREGDTLYVVLNNLESTSNTISLNTLTGLGSVSSASLSQIYWNGSEGVYESDVDVSNSWDSITLDGEAGAVLTLNLSGPQLYDLATNEVTYYGDDTLAPLNLSNGQSKIINILADTENAVSAKVRVAFNREGFGVLGEAFGIEVNGNVLSVPAEELAFDNDDTDIVSRTLEVPIGMLVDGNNEVNANFSSNGGELVSAVLVITESIGDYSGNGSFDGEDISLLVEQFGTAASGSEFDLTEDGTVNMEDVNYWLSELRGTTIGVGGDFDLDDDVDADDLAILQAHYGTGTHYGQGDTDFDGDVDGADFLAWQRSRTAGGDQPGGQLITAVTARVPEPSTLVIAFSGLTLACSRGRQRLIGRYFITN